MSSPHEPDVALVFAQGQIVHGVPDRAGQERVAQLHRLLRSTKPVGMISLAVAAVGFVVAPAHPVSIALYMVGALGLVAALVTLRSIGSRIRSAERESGLPVPAEIAETVLETHHQLGYLDEEITYWRSQPGSSDLRRRLNREIDTFQAAVRDLRAAWLRGDDASWRRAGQGVIDLADDLDALSVDVSLLVRGGDPGEPG